MFQLKSTYTVEGHPAPYETSIKFDSEAQAQAHIDKVVQRSKLTPSITEPGTFDVFQSDTTLTDGHYKFEIVPEEIPVEEVAVEPAKTKRKKESV